MPLMQGACGRHYKGTFVKGHGHGLGNGIVLLGGRLDPLSWGRLADDWQGKGYGKLFLPWRDLNDWVDAVVLGKGNEDVVCYSHASHLKAGRVPFKRR